MVQKPSLLQEASRALNRRDYRSGSVVGVFGIGSIRTDRGGAGVYQGAELAKSAICGDRGRGRGVVGNRGIAGVQGFADGVEGSSGEENAADVGAERGDRGNAPEQPRRGM